LIEPPRRREERQKVLTAEDTEDAERVQLERVELIGRQLARCGGHQIGMQEQVLRGAGAHAAPEPLQAGSGFIRTALGEP